VRQAAVDTGNPGAATASVTPEGVAGQMAGKTEWDARVAIGDDRVPIAVATDSQALIRFGASLNRPQQ
jgi:hypothetical protein